VGGCALGPRPPPPPPQTPKPQSPIPNPQLIIKYNLLYLNNYYFKKIHNKYIK